MELENLPTHSPHQQARGRDPGEGTASPLGRAPSPPGQAPLLASTDVSGSAPRNQKQSRFSPLSSPTAKVRPQEGLCPPPPTGSRAGPGLSWRGGFMPGSQVQGDRAVPRGTFPSSAPGKAGHPNRVYSEVLGGAEELREAGAQCWGLLGGGQISAAQGDGGALGPPPSGSAAHSLAGAAPGSRS